MPRPQPAAHGLWRPGLGLALWFTDDVGEPTGEPDPVTLPGPVAAVLGDRRPRRSATVPGPAGRLVAPVLTLGPERAAALLDELGPDDGAGDLRYLRWVARSVERFVAVGAVTPVLRGDDGEWLVRWAPLESVQWRTWVQTAAAAMPAALRRGGDIAAILDMATELADTYARQRLGDGPWAWVSAPSLRALVAGEALAESHVADAGAPAAWTEWAGSVRSAETLLVLRLIEPDGKRPDQHDPVAAPSDAPWRLEVCRRVPGSAPVRADPVRMSPVDLDDLAGELARALAVYPPLKRARQDPSSLDFLLTTDEAESLFLEGAPGLTKAGYEVLLPTSIATVRPALRLAGREQPGGTALTVQAGLAEIKDFAWQRAVGDAVLTASELAGLANSVSGLVKVRDRWVRADRRTLAQAARFVAEQRRAEAEGTARDLGDLLGLIADPAALPAPLVAVDGLGWLDSVYRGGTIAPVEVAAPSTLKAQLRPYQLRGLQWLVTLWRSGIGAVLADDMGLGKTIQVLALLCHERVDGAVDAPLPTLLVCPMSVVGNWVAEAQRFAPDLRVHVHHGSDRATGEAFAEATAGADIVVTTFALAARDRELLSTRRWARLVVDEAQHVKNVNTAAARALRAIPAAHRVALTGTPVENRLEDLRAVIDLVNPGLLGSARTFRNRFALPIERERDPAAVRRLNTLTSPFILRREKTDPNIAPELPEKAEFTVRASLTSEQAALYQAVLNRMIEELRESEGMGRQGWQSLVLPTLTRLKQVCNHPAHYLGDGSQLLRRGQHRSGKVELLADILETVAADGERALVFTQYAEFARMLQPWLTGLLGAEVPVLDGAVARRDRDAMVERFQAGDGAPVLVATVQSGGTGLNLTAANHVVHVDRWWNPAVENQATDRAFRIGQTRAVQVRKFVCAGTLEERIDGVIAAKRELSQMTLQVGESWLAELNNDELYDLIALRDEAVM